MYIYIYIDVEVLEDLEVVGHVPKSIHLAYVKRWPLRGTYDMVCMQVYWLKVSSGATNLKLYV